MFGNVHIRHPLPLQILLEAAKRQGKKMTTSVAGLEHFGIKLSDASKVFGKKVCAAFHSFLPMALCIDCCHFMIGNPPSLHAAVCMWSQRDEDCSANGAG